MVNQLMSHCYPFIRKRRKYLLLAAMQTISAINVVDGRLSGKDSAAKTSRVVHSQFLLNSLSANRICFNGKNLVTSVLIAQQETEFSISVTAKTKFTCNESFVIIQYLMA
jgi:hypothetical protein